MAPNPPNLSLPFHLPQHFVSPQQITPPSTSQTPNSPDQPLNSNAQAALIILLAAQIQQQQEQQPQNVVATQQNGTLSSDSGNNILSNPQVLNLLQTLVSQGDPQVQKSHSPATPPPNLQPPPINGFLPTSSVSTSSPCPTSTGIPPVNSPAKKILSNNLKLNFRSGYFKNGASKLSKVLLICTLSLIIYKDCYYIIS